MSHSFGAAKGRTLSETVQKAVGLFEKYEMPKATVRPAGKRYTPNRQPGTRPVDSPAKDD